MKIFEKIYQKVLVLWIKCGIIIYVERNKNLKTNHVASAGKEYKMNEEEMNVGEILKETAEENQTRKILEILNDCKDIEEAKEKIKALLER